MFTTADIALRGRGAAAQHVVAPGDHVGRADHAPVRQRRAGRDAPRSPARRDLHRPAADRRQRRLAGVVQRHDRRGAGLRPRADRAEIAAPATRRSARRAAGAALHARGARRSRRSGPAGKARRNADGRKVKAHRGTRWLTAPALAPLLDLAQAPGTEHTGQDPTDDAGHQVASEPHPARVEDRDERARGHLRARARGRPEARGRRARRMVPGRRRSRGLSAWPLYSHSIVPGGLLVMSSTTRLTSRISLIIRDAIRSSRSYGRRAQSAVIASSDVTARIATT